MVKLAQDLPGLWGLYVDGERVVSVPWWVVDIMRREDSLDLFESWLHGVYINSHIQGQTEGIERMQANLRALMGDGTHSEG